MLNIVNQRSGGDVGIVGAMIVQARRWASTHDWQPHSRPGDQARDRAKAPGIPAASGAGPGPDQPADPGPLVRCSPGKGGWGNGSPTSRTPARAATPLPKPMPCWPKRTPSADRRPTARLGSRELGRSGSRRASGASYRGEGAGRRGSAVRPERCRNRCSGPGENQPTPTCRPLSRGGTADTAPGHNHRLFSASIYEFW